MSTKENDLNDVRMRRAIAHEKMKKIGFLVLLANLFFSFSVLAQNNLGGWEVSFGGDSEDQGIAIIQTVDEGYLEIGFSESFGSDGDFDIFLVRTDVDGTPIWQRSFDEGYIEQPGDVIQLADESFLICGHINDLNGTPAGTASQFYLMNVSARGDLLWTKRYPNDGLRQRARRIIPTADGGFMLIGFTQEMVDGENNIMLLKLDANAEEEWRENYGTTDRDDEGRDIIEVEDGYVFVANIKGDQGPDNDIAIYRVTSLGGLVSLDVYGTDNLNEEVNDLIKTQNDELVLVGSSGSFSNAYILKGNLNGDTLWTREIDAGAIENELRSVIELEDGSLVAVGQTLPTPVNTDILLLKLSADGDLIWKRNLGDQFEFNKLGEDIARSSDGGFVIAGYSAEADQVFINDLMIVKVDSEGTYLTNMLSGKVFWSTDGCNPFEEEDQPLEGWLIRVDGTDRTYIGSTDAEGNYRIPVDTGSYQVTLLKLNDTWDMCSPFSFPVDFTVNYDTLVYNFPVRQAVDCPYLEVEATTSSLEFCAPATYVIEYCNWGAGIAGDAYVEIILDDELSYDGASIDSSMVTDNSLVFELGDLPPGMCGTFELYVQVGCEGILEGQAAFVDVHIYPDTICAPLDPDWDMSSLKVRGECDNGNIQFFASNIGTAPMTTSQEYVVTEDVIMFFQGVIDPLEPQEEIAISAPIPVNEDGSTYRLIANQVDGHPGNSFPTVAVEGCTLEGNSNYTTGQVTQFPENDQDPFVDIDVQEIISSGEASVMRGHPRGYQDSIITPTTDIEYTILFANTGMDTLNRLVIRDTLPPQLDFSSLEVGPASHPYEIELYDSGVLKITFDNLELLPDGSAAEAASQGYVKFTLSQKQNQALGTVIENRAAVYFDYIAPYRTNTVRHLVACENFLTEGCLLVDVDEPPTPTGVTITVLPNPFNTSAQFIIEGCSDCENIEMILRDAQGREVRREQHQGPSFTINRKQLAPAVYFYELRSKGLTLSTGKLLVQ